MLKRHKSCRTLHLIDRGKAKGIVSRWLHSRFDGNGNAVTRKELMFALVESSADHLLPCSLDPLVNGRMDV